MKITITFIIIIISILVMSAMSVPASSDNNDIGLMLDYSSDMLEFERLYPQSIMPKPELKPKPKSERKSLDPFPTKKHLSIIGRIADHVTDIKLKQGGWWECGIFYTDKKEIYNKALSYAYVIVHAAWEVSDPPYNKNPKILNPWGFAGTVWNESRFDRCALGANPCKVAYSMGLLTRNKLTLSHTEEDVLRAVQSDKLQKYFKKSGFDLGIGQVLSRFYSNPKDYKNMISLKGSAQETARMMMNRERWSNTDRPWTYWPGHKADWYNDKVVRWAKKLGAKKGEI